MFYANGGADWVNSAGWLSNEVHCTWSGITCNRASQVTEVILPDNNLSGSMMDLSNLSSISNIILVNNNLTGPIPDNVCANTRNISLHVDDALCADASTAKGCCNAVSNK